MSWGLVCELREWETDRQFGAALVVMQVLYRTVVVKKELSLSATGLSTFRLSPMVMSSAR